jgi:hypothetical protein
MTRNDDFQKIFGIGIEADQGLGRKPAAENDEIRTSSGRDNDEVLTMP